jgi:hypothetical protein
MWYFSRIGIFSPIEKLNNNELASLTDEDLANVYGEISVSKNNWLSA